MQVHRSFSGRKANPGAWQKIKVDWQIVAIAKVENVSTIYSDDPDVKSFAETANLNCVSLPELPLPPEEPQQNLPFDGASKRTKSKQPAILSLSPMKFQEAVTDLLKVKPPPKAEPKTKKKATKVKGLLAVPIRFALRLPANRSPTPRGRGGLSGCTLKVSAAHKPVQRPGASAPPPRIRFWPFPASARSNKASFRQKETVHTRTNPLFSVFYLKNHLKHLTRALQ